LFRVRLPALQGFGIHSRDTIPTVAEV
jgi:hypothetical protein